MIRWFIQIIFVFWFCGGLFGGEIQVASGRYSIEVDGVEVKVPFECSHDLDAGDEQVNMLIYAVHSASYDSKMYFDRVRDMVSKVPGQYLKTLIITPHFLKTEFVEESKSSGFLHWEVPPFRGSSRAFFNGKRVTISAFDVTDRILRDVVCKSNFPNLKKVVILGHSAGGQMVNRYSASGLFEMKVAKKNGIEVKYIVMAPSSYVYLNKERLVDTSSWEFSVPENGPENYNDWGYGLDRLYVYHRKNGIVAEKIREGFAGKKVLYLVGSEDDKHDATVSVTPAAMLQGENRKERAEIYFKYLVHLFGEKIKKTQKFRVIKGAGHNGRSLMMSPQALRFVFL